MKKWYLSVVATLTVLLGIHPSKVLADDEDANAYYAANITAAAYTNMQKAYKTTVTTTTTVTRTGRGRGRRVTTTTTSASSYPNTQYAVNNFASAAYYADLARDYINNGDFTTALSMEAYAYNYTYAGYAYALDVAANGPASTRGFAAIAAQEAVQALYYLYLAQNTSPF